MCARKPLQSDDSVTEVTFDKTLCARRHLWSDHYHQTEQSSDQTISRSKWAMIILLFDRTNFQTLEFWSGNTPCELDLCLIRGHFRLTPQPGYNYTLNLLSCLLLGDEMIRADYHKMPHAKRIEYTRLNLWMFSFIIWNRREHQIYISDHVHCFTSIQFLYKYFTVVLPFTHCLFF